MTRNDIVQLSGDDNILFCDGFDDAIIGIAQQFNTVCVAYDKEKCIEILSKDMDREDAEEYFSFNVIGSWMGEQTPIFLSSK
tara:strand:- start:1586 stop:1831 length:246 start_codon:yes stop_codon:yes gene_type:complete